MRKIQTVSVHFPESTRNYRVGTENIMKIEEHRAAGEGDRWYYDVHYEDGSMLRLFNFSEVIFNKEENFI